jgi:hypothetical protein
MPHCDIDYSNTIIYKITCKDQEVSDIYVGHTTNFVQRKHAHKQTCNNPNAVSYNCKVYRIIRTHGGWNNWHMEIINFFNCADLFEAKQKEQEYFISLHANLNSIEPLPPNILKEKPIIVKPIIEKPIIEKPIIEKPIIVKPIIKKPIIKNTLKFSCEKCKFNTDNKKDYKKHLSTAKHLYNDTGLSGSGPILGKKQVICAGCKKTYSCRQTLHIHRKKCELHLKKKEGIAVEQAQCIENKDSLIQHLLKENSEFKNMIIEFVKNNTELQKQSIEYQKQVLDVCAKNPPGIINNTINNNNNTLNKNKTFNLQVFLNEDCKNAMNMSEFMNSFVLHVEDLERVGKVGYVEGISDIIIKELQKLDITQRPMHCSDAKRETIYIKENDIWEKDVPGNLKVKKVISHVSRKNLQILKEWTALHPAYKNSTDPENDEYLHLVKTALGSSADQDQTENKIVRRLIKEITIEKN